MWDTHLPRSNDKLPLAIASMKQTDCHEPTRREYLESANVLVPSCSHQPQPQGRPARQATRAEAPGKQQVVLSKCDKFQRAAQPPSCQACLCHDRSMITVKHQPAEASVRKVVNQAFFHRSLIHTLLQPEEGWGYSSPFSEPANWHVQLTQHYRR